jgi:hypothetical protein
MTTSQVPIIKPDPSDYVFSETTERYTEWKNNNKEKAVFRLLTHEKRTGRPNARHKDSGRCQASVFLKIEVLPGQTIKLKSEFDDAIRKVSKETGQVVGGLCPWLTKVGEEDVTVHSSLDYKLAIQEEQAHHMLDAMKKENDLREALKEIERRKLLMEAGKTENEAKALPDMPDIKRPVGRPVNTITKE